MHCNVRPFPAGSPRGLCCPSVLAWSSCIRQGLSFLKPSVCLFVLGHSECDSGHMISTSGIHRGWNIDLDLCRCEGQERKHKKAKTFLVGLLCRGRTLRCPLSVLFRSSCMLVMQAVMGNLSLTSASSADFSRCYHLTVQTQMSTDVTGQ